MASVPNVTSLFISMANSESRIRFNVCRPGFLVIRASARPDDCVSVLQKLFPSLDLRFLCQGEILAMDATLRSSGIREGDVVIAVPSSDSTISDMHRWMALTRSSDSRQESVQSILNVSTRPETLRLRDLAWRKIELKPKRFGRLARRFTEYPDARLTQLSEASVIPENLLEPSTAPLNVSWD
jgi:hypothetical protein